MWLGEVLILLNSRQQATQLHQINSAHHMQFLKNRFVNVVPYMCMGVRDVRDRDCGNSLVRLVSTVRFKAAGFTVCTHVHTDSRSITPSSTIVRPAYVELFRPEVDNIIYRSIRVRFCWSDIRQFTIRFQIQPKC